MNKRKPVLILGGWGSGQIVTSVIDDINEVEPTWEILGFLNDFEEIGLKIGAYPVVGFTSEASEYAEKGVYLHYAMRNPKYAKQRIKHFEDMNIPIDAFATFIHPKAHISGNSGIGNGSLLCAQSYLSFGAKVCNHNHLYGNALIGHDSVIEDYVWVAANAVVGARCVISKGAHIGAGSSMGADIKIGSYCLVGLGAVVTKSFESGNVIFGNPARIMGHVDQYDDDTPVQSSK